MIDALLIHAETLDPGLANSIEIFLDRLQLLFGER